MQGDYFAFSQGPPTQYYPTYGYTIGAALPTHRNLEKLKKGKLRHDGRKYEEMTNSTDESIHLVRSRKTGESAPAKNYSDSNDSEQKKRSQSGNSLGKGSANGDQEIQRNRSVSEDRNDCTSPVNDDHSRNQSIHRVSSETASNKAKSKKKREKKNKKGGMWHYSDIDSSKYMDNRLVEHIYLQNNPLLQTQMPMMTPIVPGIPGYGQEMQMTQMQYGGAEPSYAAAYQDYAQQQAAAMSQYQQQQQQQYGVPLTQDQYYSNPWAQQQQAQQQVYDNNQGGPVTSVDCTIQYNPNGQQQNATPVQQPVSYDQAAAAYQQQYYPVNVDQQGYTQMPLDQSQSFGPTDAYGQQQQNLPGLPPGAKIVAEYFLGYLDEQQPQQQQQTTIAHSQSSKEDVVIEVWEKQKRNKKRHDSPTIQDIISSGGSMGGMDLMSNVERLDRSDRCDRTDIRSERGIDRYEDRKVDGNDLRRLKEDIINTIQKELGSLKIRPDGKTETIQPIFLMPKNSDQGQPKPIYIPRNIYVPVIRPVFVPRERIIVRPQIIHVARPVLVDRPVPIQQRPIVIERDRPVPVRVETVERSDSSGGNCGDSGQETSYHEFTQNYSAPANVQSGSSGNTGQLLNNNPHNDQQYGYSTNTSNYQYSEQVDYEDNRRKQEVLNILEEAERRKQNLQSKSNEDLIAQYKYVKYDASADNVKALDNMLGNSTGYTLEVLDQRVSDKFEKTDQETIKARYGVDSFQYLPAGVELTSQQNRSGSSNFGNMQQNSNNGSTEFFTNGGQKLGNSGSYKNLNLNGEITRRN